MTGMDASQVKQLAKRSQKETLENSFLTHWTLLFPQLPPPVRQHKVKNPKTGRDWRIDFAWPEWKLGVEIQGGAWVGGGHNTALGQARDYERQNTLTRYGWRMLFFSTPMLKDMASAVEQVAEILCNAEEVEDADDSGTSRRSG
jgi:very-short-patch-repair endonuclease